MSDVMQRLRERKLVQWALAYVAAAFALIQVLDIVVQRFGWPEQTIRFVIIAVCVGFFVTLVLAWYHGERGAQRVSSAELLILALLLGIGGAAVWQFGPRKTDAPHAETTSGTDPKSIAVLPFVNMSGEKDNEYFSDGISEEILNVLAGISDLHVAARTSSFSFRDGKHEAREIAQELRVRMLLEGSVRKQGDRARITAQLINADDGYHLWSQTYDRELKDIFAVQDEIASAVAEELKVKLGDAAKAPPKKTRSADAHDAYLRGLALWQQRGEGRLLQAIDHFEAAITADPQFAEAYAGLALVYTIIPDYSGKFTYDEALGRARDYGERALALDPNVPEIYAVLGYLADSDRRRETAQALYRHAIALRPSFATAYQWLGNSLWTGGDVSGAIVSLERASALDPRSSVIANNHGILLLSVRRTDEAIGLCAATLKESPQDQTCLESTAFATLVAGDLAAARALFLRYAQVVNPDGTAFTNTVFDALDGRGDRSAVARRLATFGPQSAYDRKTENVFSVCIIPTLLVMLGEPKLAIANLDPFADTDRSGQSEMAAMMMSLGKLHCDPDFAALIKRMKTQDPHYATLCTK